MPKNQLDPSIHFDRTPTCDRQADTDTDTDTDTGTWLVLARVKTKPPPSAPDSVDETRFADSRVANHRHVQRNVLPLLLLSRQKSPTALHSGRSELSLTSIDVVLRNPLKVRHVEVETAATHLPTLSCNVKRLQ